MAQWQEIATLPEYQQLDIPSKRKVLNNYISNNFGKLKEFQNLPLEHKAKLQFQMEKTAGITGIDNPFEQPQAIPTTTPTEVIPRPQPQPLPPPTRQEQLAKESTDYGFNLLTGTASKTGEEAYNLAKRTFSPFDIRNITDPFGKVIYDELMSGKPVMQAYKDMGKGVVQTGYDTLQGLSHVVGDPLGTTDIASGNFTFPTLRQAWSERPYESAVGISPIAVPLLMKGIDAIPRRQPEIKISPEAKQAYTEGIKEIGQTLKNIPDKTRPQQARVVADLRNQMRSALFKDDVSTINSIVADFREGQTIPTTQPPASTLNIPEINATTLREKNAAIQARQKTVIPETPEYQAEMAKLMQQQNTDEFPFGVNAPATIPEGLVESAQPPPNIFARIKEFANGIKIDKSLADHDIKGAEIYKLNQKQGGFFNYKPNSVTLDEAAQVLHTTTDDIVQQFNDALSKKEMNDKSLAEVQSYVLSTKPKFSQPKMFEGEKVDIAPKMETDIQGQQKLFNPKGEIVKEPSLDEMQKEYEKIQYTNDASSQLKYGEPLENRSYEYKIFDHSKNKYIIIKADPIILKGFENNQYFIHENPIDNNWKITQGLQTEKGNGKTKQEAIDNFYKYNQASIPHETQAIQTTTGENLPQRLLEETKGQAVPYGERKDIVSESPRNYDKLDKLKQSLINRKYDPSIPLSHYRELGKPDYITIAPKATTQEAFHKLRTLLIDNRKGYDIVGGKPVKTDAEYLIGNPSEDIVSEPKAGMLRHGEEIPKYVESLNVSHVDENYDVKKLMTDLVSFGKYEKETKTFDEIHKAGQELGITEESILKNAQKFPELSGKLDAMRQVAVDTSLKTHLLMKEALKIAIDKTLPQETRDKALIVANMQRDKAAAVMSATLGEISDSGRALGIMRRKIQGYKAMKNHSAMLKALGGREINLEILERYANIDPSDIRAVSQFTLSLQRAKIPEMIVEAWKSAILSSPPTHAANAFNNAVNFLLKQTETGVSAGMQAVKHAVTGKPRLRFFGELKAEHIGAWQGLKEGMKEAIQTFKTEMAPDINKIESPRRHAIPSKRVKIFGKTFILGGKQVRLPLRLLIAADELAKGVIYRAEMNAEAYRIASREGKRGKERAKRVTELLNNPLAPERKAMEELAHNEGLYRTLNKPLGKWGNQIMKLRDTQIGESGFRPLEYVMPFVRTPTNAIKMSLEYTPINFVKLGYETYKGDLKNEQITNEFAKPFIGSIIIGGLIAYIMEGYIVGKSEDEKIPSYSVKIGDNYYQYNRNDTLGSLMGFTADYVNILTRSNPKNKESIAGELITAFTKNFINKTFFMGLSSLIKAIDDPERYGEKWINRLSGSVVPGFVNSVTKTLDTTQRQVETPLDAIKSRIPEVSKDMLPARGKFGETKESSKLNTVTPFYITYDTKDPVDNELIRLRESIGFEVGRPQRRIRNIDLTQTQYDRYLKESGQMAKDRIKTYISSNEYKLLTDDDKARDIDNIINHSRREIANKIYFELREKQPQN